MYHDINNKESLDRASFTNQKQTNNYSLKQSPLNFILTVLIMIALVVCISAIIYIITTGHGENFTEFYILNTSGKAEYYPTEAKANEEVKLIMGIVNHENKKITYNVDITINGKIIKSIGPIQLESEEKWEKIIGFTPVKIGNNQQVEFKLHKDNDKDNSELTLRLWLNVRK